MFRLVIALTLVAACLAVHDSHCCSSGDLHTVQDQWNRIWNTPDSGAVKVVFGRAIFSEFLTKEPESKVLFSRVNVDHPESAEFSAHMIRVLTGLDISINLLGDDSALDAELNHLNMQHRAREGVTAHHFKVFAEVLSHTLAQVLSDYDGVAWTACQSRMGTLLKAGL